MPFPNAPAVPIDAAAAQLVLRIHGGAQDGELITISGGDHRVGDHPQAGIRVSGLGVQGVCFQLRCGEDGATVEAPEPGVHVNGVLSTNWTLGAGDWIAIGPVQLEVLEVLSCSGEGQIAPSPSPPPSHATVQERPATVDDSRSAPQRGDEPSESSYGTTKSLELFRRMGIDVARDESDSDDQEVADRGAGASPGGVPAAAPATDDAGEILEYMQALLKRVGAPTGNSPDSGSAARQRNPSPDQKPARRPTESPATSGAAAGSSNAAAHANIERHRVRVPAGPIDLTAMRALANRTARDAIHSHTRKRLVSRVTHSMMVAALSLISGAGVALASWFGMILGVFFYVGLALAVVGVLLCFGCVVQAATHPRRAQHEPEANDTADDT